MWDMDYWTGRWISSEQNVVSEYGRIKKYQESNDTSAGFNLYYFTLLYQKEQVNTSPLCLMGS